MKLTDRQPIFDTTPELELLISRIVLKAYKYVVTRTEYWAILTDTSSGDTWSFWWPGSDDTKTNKTFTDKLSIVEYRKAGSTNALFRVNNVQPYISTIAKFESAFNLEPDERTQADIINDMIKALPQEDV